MQAPIDDEQPYDGDGDAPDELNTGVVAEEDPAGEEIVNEVAKSNNMIDSRVGKKYTFYISASDVFNHGNVGSGSGCKFVLVKVATQCSHTSACKRRSMDALLSAKDDRHRVQGWFVPEGLHPEPKGHCSSEEVDNNTKRKKSSATTGDCRHPVLQRRDRGARTSASPAQNEEERCAWIPQARSFSLGRPSR